MDSSGGALDESENSNSSVIPVLLDNWFAVHFVEIRRVFPFVPGEQSRSSVH